MQNIQNLFFAFILIWDYDNGVTIDIMSYFIYLWYVEIKNQKFTNVYRVHIYIYF
jgi:hypothetical protein